MSKKRRFDDPEGVQNTIILDGSVPTTSIEKRRLLEAPDDPRSEKRALAAGIQRFHEKHGFFIFENVYKTAARTSFYKPVLARNGKRVSLIFTL